MRDKERETEPERDASSDEVEVKVMARCEGDRRRRTGRICSNQQMEI